MQNRSWKELAYSVGASIALALAVVAGLMIENPYEVSLRDTVRPLLVLAGVAIIGTFLAGLVHRRLMPIFAAALYAFFQYAPLRELIPYDRWDGVMTVAILALALCGLFLVLRRLDRLRAARLVFLVSAAVGIGSAAVVATQVFDELFAAPVPVIDQEFATRSLAAAEAAGKIPDELPDIIYVVPDRYPNATTLQVEYGYDNSAFYRELRARGFVLREDAWANYPLTFVSLASTLNGGYLEPLRAAYGPRSADRRPVYRLIEQNVVQDRLRRAGYRYVHLGGWWEPTRTSRYAHENYLGYPPQALLERLPEFEWALVRKTILPTIFHRLGSGAEDYECVRLKRQLERLRSIGNERRPVFAFVHMFIPHPPITMDADGTCLPRALRADNWERFKAGFIQYVQHLNAQLLDIVDEQLRRRADSGRKLIFVIQSDEGPYTKPMAQYDDYEFARMSDRDLKMKMGIVNAILLPQDLKTNVGSLRTPINNWRVIFNAVFGTELTMLPDSAFVYQGGSEWEHVFDFANVSPALGLAQSRAEMARH